jgi:hypothetical protein
LTDDLRKLFLRSWFERGLFLEAYVLLGVMRVAILVLPFRKIASLLGLTQGSAPSEASLNVFPCTEKIGWAIRAAAARTPWQSACLVQALSGMVMLIRRGIDATLYLGVAKHENNTETLSAHAWLSCGNTVLTGDGGLERYSTLSSFYGTKKSGRDH